MTKAFETFLSDPDERVQKYAEQLAAGDLRARTKVGECNLVAKWIGTGGASATSRGLHLPRRTHRYARCTGI